MGELAAASSSPPPAVLQVVPKRAWAQLLRPGAAPTRRDRPSATAAPPPPPPPTPVVAQIRHRWPSTSQCGSRPPACAPACSLLPWHAPPACPGAQHHSTPNPSRQPRIRVPREWRLLRRSNSCSSPSRSSFSSRRTYSNQVSDPWRSAPKSHSHASRWGRARAAPLLSSLFPMAASLGRRPPLRCVPRTCILLFAVSL
jgi:hypothetical protein